MNRGLLYKSAREAMALVALLSGALLVVEAVLGYVLPTYLQQFSDQLLQIEFFRTLIRALLGTDLGELPGPDTFSALAWVHPAVLAIVWTQAIVLCTRMPAGEIDRGTIDVLFGLPVSRWRVYVSDSIVVAAAGAVLLVMGLLGHRLGFLAVEGVDPPALGRLAMITANFYLLYLAVCGIASLVSALSNRRGRAVATVFGILLASFLLSFIAQFWEPAQRVAFLSVLDYYRPLLILQDDAWPVANLAVLGGCAIATWTAGGLWFARRDICTV